MQADFALRREVDDEVSVFRGNRCRGDSCRKAESGMGKAIIGIADRADQGGDGAKVGGGFPGARLHDSARPLRRRQRQVRRRLSA